MAEEKEEWSGENHLCYAYVICKGDFIVKTFGICFIVPYPTLPPPHSTTSQNNQGHGPMG